MSTLNVPVTSDVVMHHTKEGAKIRAKYLGPVPDTMRHKFLVKMGSDMTVVVLYHEKALKDYDIVLDNE